MDKAIVSLFYTISTKVEIGIFSEIIANTGVFCANFPHVSSRNPGFLNKHKEDRTTFKPKISEVIK